MANLGLLKTVEIRQIWPKEACDFTPWLADNLESLSSALGLQLEIQQREADCGDFSLDILAIDLGSSRPVIIENQLTPTDHDHLGKLLTYAAGFDAGVVIWIAESVRDEHRQALDWLNQRTDEETDFFAVVVEGIQIDDSRPAVNFRPVAFPNEWQKEGHRKKQRSVSSKTEAYRDFFQLLIDELRQTYKFTNARVGQLQSWYMFSTGVSGVHYGFSFTGDGRSRTELNLNLGNRELNKAMFDLLHEDRERLEQQFGKPFSWERLDTKNASRIAVYSAGTITDTESELKTIRSWAIENLLRFKQVFGPLIRPTLDMAHESLDIAH